MGLFWLIQIIKVCISFIEKLDFARSLILYIAFFTSFLIFSVISRLALTIE